MDFQINQPKYWCFNCQRHFASSKQVNSCLACQSPAIQQVPLNSPSDPANFLVYHIPQATTPTITNLSAQNQPPQSQPQPQPAQQPSNENPSSGLGFHMIPIRIISAPQIHFMRMTVLLDESDSMMSQFHNMMRRTGIDNFLNSLMGQNGLTSATQQEIGQLQKVNSVADCSVCQENEGENISAGYKLKCGHAFHIDCLSPWLERTNTCPTCRSHI